MLVMRELSRGDISTVNSWRADPELISCLGAPYRYIGLEVDEAWFDSYLASRGNTVRCAVVDDGRPEEILCLVTLAGIDWVHGVATLHIMIGGSENRGKGVGTFAVGSMLSHAFDDLGLYRVELDVLAENAPAIGLYRKMGFSLEGTKREAAFKSGRRVDVHEMAIPEREWRARDSNRVGVSSERAPE